MDGLAFGADVGLGPVDPAGERGLGRIGPRATRGQGRESEREKEVSCVHRAVILAQSAPRTNPKLRPRSGFDFAEVGMVESGPNSAAGGGKGPP